MNTTMSVLEQMAAGIMSAKQGRGSALTPVGSEASLPGLPARVAAPFPNDNPHEVLEVAVKAIRREIAYILEALDNIDATNGTAPVGATLPNTEAIKHRVEQMADTKFAIAMAAKSAAAQDEFFAKDDGPAKPQTGWACPTHGRTAVKVETSRKGRIYGLCTECREFEK